MAAKRERGKFLIHSMQPGEPDRQSRALRWLAGLAGAQVILYAVIAWLSREFVFGERLRERPIIAVLVLFAGCFALYTASLVVALRCRRSCRLAWMVLLPALVFRLILLFSEPIQEIDIYRYLWDGAVTARGVSPFRYAPGDVRAAEWDRDMSPELQRLVQLRDESPAMSEVLQRIHYAELPTVYPPVSQAVFALADRLTPPAASVSARVTMLKAVLLTFDVATILLVWLLVAAAGKHPGWVISYAWCPLVMKEFAGSGHLDAIAVFLTTAAIVGAVMAFDAQRRSSLRWPIAAGLLLGLAVGAKLYAIVLLPLATVMVMHRGGARRGIAFVLVSVAVSGASLAPMWLPRLSYPATSARHVPGTPPNVLEEPTDAGQANASGTATDPLAGLSTFLTRWEMNDFLFMIAIENVRPSDMRQGQPTAWFSIVPDSWRTTVIAPFADALSINAELAALLLVRAFAASVFITVALSLLWWAHRENTLSAFLQAAFLTLAWFWLLAPTQNPWYWTWVLPLLPFARGRAWFAVSGLVFAYYLRFWLSYHWPDEPVLGTQYDGAAFFDFVVTWVEYGPWFVWLTAAFLLRRRAEASARFSRPA